MKHYLYYVLLGILSFHITACGSDEMAGKPEYKTDLKEDTIALTSFKDTFPLHYESYMQNMETEVMTRYKGSVPYPKNNVTDPLPKGFKNGQPYLKNLWLGYPFSFEYNEARGHAYAIEDFLEIDRINRYDEKGGLPATCWTCKTPKVNEWVKEYGDKFWAMDVNAFRDKIDPKNEGIVCASCHNPTNMKLQVTTQPARDYLDSVGKDPDNLSRKDALNFSCGQCHVEYFFNKPNMKEANAPQKPVFPWKNGFTPQEIYEYYETISTNDPATTPKGFPTQFFDWIHPVSQTPMLKAQHPEYETFMSSAHAQAGVTCVDCHMPYKRVSNGEKMTSHWWTSPLKDPDLTACRKCHQQSPDYLRNRVYATQDKVYQQLLKAQEISVKAHQAVRYAIDFKGVNEDTLIKAKHALRKGQWFWDFISAEGSVGFHNPQLSFETLADSIEQSQKAIDLALEATGFNQDLAKKLAKPITELVPPIKEHSRKLAQDPKHMQSHPWLTYLPVLPKKEQVWEGQHKK